MMKPNPLLSVRDLSVGFSSGQGVLTAVSGVSLDVAAGETLALLGESGCGKSATALSLLRLLPAAGRILAGEVVFEGRELLALPETEMRAVLRRAADARGVFLSDEVMNFVLGRFSRDLGSLMQLLDHLDCYALQTQRAITIPLIKSMLQNE